MKQKFRTIVADPPWQVSAKRIGTYPDTPDARWRVTDMPYTTLSLSQLCDLPIADCAESNAVLYLWTVTACLRSAYTVADAWGFHCVQVLVWSKPPKGVAGGDYVGSSEFILYCKRGSPQAKRKQMGSVFSWSRPRDEHSAKPEAFLDHVEEMHPGPYLELFARRARFGWDYWGNESLQTVELEGVRGAD